MSRIKKPNQQEQQRPSMRLMRALILLLSLCFVASLLKQADVFSTSTTGDQHQSSRRTRKSSLASDPNVLIAEQSLRGQPSKNQIKSLVAAAHDGKNRRIEFDLELLKGEETSGTLVIELMEEWAPIGVEHFQKLMEAEFYNQVRFFRVVPNFVAQFGISGDPATQRAWRNQQLVDDPVQHPNQRGTITYATSGPNTRTTQLFINLKDNLSLDEQGFAPFARIVQGLDLIDQIQDKYREKPNQGQIQQRGNEYLIENFPDLSFIGNARII